MQRAARNVQRVNTRSCNTRHATDNVGCATLTQRAALPRPTDSVKRALRRVRRCSYAAVHALLEPAGAALRLCLKPEETDGQAGFPLSLIPIYPDLRSKYSHLERESPQVGTCADSHLERESFQVGTYADSHLERESPQVGTYADSHFGAQIAPSGNRPNPTYSTPGPADLNGSHVASMRTEGLRGEPHRV
jgi:hypothetical protein